MSNSNVYTNTNVVRLEKPAHNFELSTSGCGFPVYLAIPSYKVPSTHGDDDKFHQCYSHRIIVGCPNGHDYPVDYAAVKAGYGLVNHKDIFENIERSLMLALDSRTLASCKVYNAQGYQGRDWLRRYTFEGLAVDPDNRSPICFTIYAKHSYGAGALRVMFGETRLICLNGAVSVGYECIYRRHSRGFTVDRLPHIFARIDEQIEKFHERMRMLKVLGTNILDLEKVEQFLIDAGFSPRRAKTMLEAFIRYLVKEAKGDTAAAAHRATVLKLYHFLTYYASHNEAFAAVRKTQQDNVQMTLLKRQVDIGSLDLTNMLNQTRQAT